jgi:hypothetical protein
MLQYIVLLRERMSIEGMRRRSSKAQTLWYNCGHNILVCGIYNLSPHLHTYSTKAERKIQIKNTGELGVLSYLRYDNLVNKIENSRLDPLAEHFMKFHKHRKGLWFYI